MAKRVETFNLHHQVQVAAVFENGRIRPVWFDLEGVRIHVREVSFTWAHQEGSAKILNFGVWDGQNTFELHFNTKSFAWSVGIVQETILLG